MYGSLPETNVRAQPGGTPRMSEREWRDSMLSLLPSLRAFAWSLARNGADADDLVQETLIRAWGKRDKHTPGTTLRARLFTILRNTWYTPVGKRKREVPHEGGHLAETLTAAPNQEWRCELKSPKAALDQLPPEHREAIVMVGTAGPSHEEAAEISGCALGTIKSRVNRARNRLARALDMPSPGGAWS